MDAFLGCFAVTAAILPLERQFAAKKGNVFGGIWWVRGESFRGFSLERVLSETQYRRDSACCCR